MNRILILFFIGLSIVAQAQVGGANVFEFITLSPSARLTGLGDNLITVTDDDIVLAYANPASLNKNMHQSISVSQNFHFKDINNGYVAYGHHLKKYNLTCHAGLNYIDYGDFEYADIYGERFGNFTASEMALTTGVARQLNTNYSIGANMKFIYSRLEDFTSTGIAFDLAGNYHNPEKRFQASFVIKNMGGQLTSYYSNRESIPFDIQFGVSKKLAHLPFRFSVIGHKLHRWNILYDDPNQEDNSLLFGEEPEENKFAIWTDNFFRHIIFNGEFLIGKKENFRMRFGYNHFRRSELRVTQYTSFGGFSGGVGLKINRFRFDYGFGIWHLAGSNHHITLSTNIQSFRKKI